MKEYFLFIGIQTPHLLDLLKEVPGFEENSYPIEDENGLADFGRDSYFISVNWFNSVKLGIPEELAKISEPPTGISESVYRYIIVDWPDSRDLKELDGDGFRGQSYLICDEKGQEDFGSSAYFVNKKWYEEVKTKISKRCSCCNDNRFEIIGAAKKDLLDSTNIDSDPEEMKVIDNILFRCWQMGWLDKYDNSKHENERS